MPETGTTRGMQELDTIEDQTISTLTEVLKPQQVPPRVLKSAPGEAVARSRLANEPLSAPSRSSGSIPNHPNSGLQKAKFGSLSADFRAGVGALMLPERGQVTGTLPGVTVTARAHRGIGRKAATYGHRAWHWPPQVQPRSTIEFSLNVLAIQIGTSAPTRTHTKHQPHTRPYSG